MSSIPSVFNRCGVKLRSMRWNVNEASRFGSPLYCTLSPITGVCKEDLASACERFSYRHRKENWSIALVSWENPRGLPPAPEALAALAELVGIGL